MSDKVTLVEVGPRDGLQNEKAQLSVQQKHDFIKRLAVAGLNEIEAGAFVSPRWVPQMSGSDALLEAIYNDDSLKQQNFSVLVPNVRGLERALKVGATEIAIFAAASESFSLKNTNCTIAQSYDRLIAVCERAKDAGIRIRGYLSCIAYCPYEGAIPAGAVIDGVEKLINMGCYEVSLGDTVGKATAPEIKKLLKLLLKAVPADQLAGHYHDTYGQALANINVSLDLGLRRFDSSVSGLGGCPYALGAGGNVATEDVVYLLKGLGQGQQYDLEAIAKVGQWVSTILERPVGSKVALATLAETLHH